MTPRVLHAYPVASRGDVVDTYHGVHVEDPYRWLEDVDSPETAAWVAQENELTGAYLAAAASRDAIRERLTNVWNYERFSVPSREGAQYVYYRNSGLQNQAVLYVAPSVNGPERVLLDPNTLSADGTVALSGLSFSHDGSLAAYALSVSGSDWLEWHVRDVATGTDLPDVVRWSKFSGAAWRVDGSGFYYSRYDEPGDAQFKEANYFHKLYFHAIGTPQADDVLVYERPDHKDWNLAAVVSDDGRWLVVHAGEGTDWRNRVYVLDLTVADAAMIDVLTDGDASYQFVGNDGDRLYFQTSVDAPRGRVIGVDVATGSVVEIVAQTADALNGVALFGDRVLALYLHDAHSLVRLYDLRGAAVGEIALPGLGTAGGFEGKRTDTETFFSFTSYTTPSTIYRYDFLTGVTSEVFAPTVAFDPHDFTSEQVFYTSKDGTRVPMIVTSKRGLVLDGTAPTILYGYGGFDISVTPSFSPATLVWLEMGGIYAVANLRGGGEYGEEWHLAGTKEKKQNVFDDCIAAAEFLIAAGYTSTPKLAVMGGSNGGLLVGAMITQRPDLFGAAIAAVGVMDMLRFQTFTIGWAWTPEYGSSDNESDFATLHAYSPLHNLKAGVAYPATLVTTADHDDRVFPAHSFKFAAQLQHVQSGDAPVLIRIDLKAGHGAGKPTSKVIDEATDRYAFLVRALGMEP